MLSGDSFAVTWVLPAVVCVYDCHGASESFGLPSGSLKHCDSSLRVVFPLRSAPSLPLFSLQFAKHSVTLRTSLSLMCKEVSRESVASFALCC